MTLVRRRADSVPAPLCYNWPVRAKMTFDSLILAAVADELNGGLADGKVMDVHQPEPLDAVLTIRTPGANHMLLISANAESPRIHLTSTKRPNPQTPPNFCMLLRKHLKGARFCGAEQVDFDRILRLGFTAYDGERLVLVVEIMGKHSNVILTNEAERILGAIKPVGKSKSRYREVLPGRQYVPPPSQDKLDPLTISREEIARLTAQAFPEKPSASNEVASWLTKTFTGISPFAAGELVARSGADAENLADAFANLFDDVQSRRFSPVLITDDAGQSIGFYPFPTEQHPEANRHERPSISAVADMYYAGALPRGAFDDASRQLIGRLRKDLEAAETMVESIRKNLTECEQAERLKQIGEIILAQTASIPQHAESVELLDYYDPSGAKIIVRLNARLSPAENAEAYFKKYHKAITGAEALHERLLDANARMELIKKTLDSADSITSMEQIGRLTEILEGAGVRVRKQEEPSRRKEPEFEGRRIAKIVSDGWEILVGQNSEANDYLLTRVAKPNDIWIHVKASSSAHVVIRTNGKPESVPRSVLYAAAEQAARHSDSKHSSLVPVDYTLRKHVRKPKGAPSGKALYQNEKTIYITPNLRG